MSTSNRASRIRPVAIALVAVLVVGGSLGPLATASEVEAQPHRHDRWGDRTRIVLVDRTVEAEPVEEALSLDDPVDAAEPIPLSTGPFDDPARILPGTDRVTVTVSWHDVAPSEEIPRPRVCFRVDETWPSSCSDGDAKVRSHTFEESGSNWTFPVNASDVDDGHAQVSDWRFVLEPCARADARCLQDTRSFDVRIAVEDDGGDLPLEPAHPDLWDGASSRSLFEDHVVAEGDAHADAEPAVRELLALEAEPIWTVDGDEARANSSAGNVSDVAIVPPATEGIDATLRWRSTPSTDLHLYFRLPADEPGTWRSAYETRSDPACDGHGWPGARYRCDTYHIWVTPDRVDGFYEEATDWTFGVGPSDGSPTAITDYEVTLDADVTR